jgi:hypothetical protein
MHVLKVALVKRYLKLGWNVLKIKDDMKSMREDFVLNNQSQMLLMLSMATNEMIRLVAISPDMWLMETTAGQFYLFYLFI